MLSPLPSCAGHQGSQGVCLCVGSMGGMGKTEQPRVPARASHVLCSGDT